MKNGQRSVSTSVARFFFATGYGYHVGFLPIARIAETKENGAIERYDWPPLGFS
jgi:hypothetical protein